jgi:hypothetical protein
LNRAWFKDVEDLLAIRAPRQRLRRGVSEPPRVIFGATPFWSHDSVAYVPVPRDSALAVRDWSPPSNDAELLLNQRNRYFQFASAWRTRLPRSAEALEALALALDLLGNPSAFDTLAHARQFAPDAANATRLAVLEVWMRVKYAVPADTQGLRIARRLADSVLRFAQTTDVTAARGLASLAAVTGHASLAAHYSRIADASGAPAALGAIAPSLIAFAAMGGPADSVQHYATAVAHAIDASTGTLNRPRARLEWLLRAAMLSLPNDYLSRSFAVDSEARGIPERILLAWRRGARQDAESLLTAVRSERIKRGILASDLAIDGLLFEATVFASFNDTNKVAEWLDPVLDSLPKRSPINLADVAQAGPLIRAMSARAIIADKAGDVALARRWTAAVATLWDGGDSDVQRVLKTLPRER